MVNNSYILHPTQIEKYLEETEHKLIMITKDKLRPPSYRTLIKIINSSSSPNIIYFITHVAHRFAYNTNKRKLSPLHYILTILNKTDKWVTIIDPLANPLFPSAYSLSTEKALIKTLPSGWNTEIILWEGVQDKMKEVYPDSCGYWCIAMINHLETGEELDNISTDLSKIIKIFKDIN